MKKLNLLIGIFLILILSGATAMANTVTVMVGDIGDINIGAFDLYFYEPDGTYGWPVETDSSVFPPTSDFTMTAGDAFPFGMEDYWYVTTYINSDTPDIDLAKGLGGYDEYDNVLNALETGTLLTLVSADTLFGIDLSDTGNHFYESISYDLLNGSLTMSESWIGDDQTVTISAVPIPATVLLLGSGLVGLICIRRRPMKRS